MRSNEILKRTVGFKSPTICLPFSFSRRVGVPVSRVPPGAFFQLCRPRTVRSGPSSRGKWIIDGTKQWYSFVRCATARNMCSMHSARLSIRQFCALRVVPSISRTSGPSYWVESSTVRYIWLSDRCLLKIIRNYNRPHIRSIAFKCGCQSPRYEYRLDIKKIISTVTHTYTRTRAQFMLFIYIYISIYMYTYFLIFYR